MKCIFLSVWLGGVREKAGRHTQTNIGPKQGKNADGLLYTCS